MIDWSDETENVEKGIAKILGNIVWLLKEAEKLIESKRPGKRMRFDKSEQQESSSR